MTEKIEIKIKYKTPLAHFYYPCGWQYFCEIVYDGDRYTVSISEEQYNNNSDYLYFLVTKRFFGGYKFYCLSIFGY